MRHDATTAECHVFTFKGGMLSAVAHDLRIRVGRFTIEIDEEAGTLEARFFADSLRVECAMKDGREDPGTLRESQKREIEGNIVDEVLHARKHPEIVFRAKCAAPTSAAKGAVEEQRLEGTLALHGAQRPLRTTARRQGERWIAEVELHQPDFGIKPYSALLGTLKVLPTVRVRVSMPA